MMLSPFPLRTFLLASAITLCHLPTQSVRAADSLRRQFVTPPAAARPWVYWHFMDGILSLEGMMADLEAMKKAGIGGAWKADVSLNGGTR